ncbi:hypothetical protein SANA_29600 [Gottschalkiaceae bacterium SANA]|nr:hypothetical protein SANA_29600 [Gottschalkiaceae bacterium SANA]
MGETGKENQGESIGKKLAKDAGVHLGVKNTSNTVADQVVFNARQGHGYAGEHANHLADKMMGKKAKLVGQGNELDGADRLVNGELIQTKYCRSGSDCIRECFDGDRFRYVNRDGSPMKIEVPSDKYDAALDAMRDRINKGEIPGVTDPKDAEKIVKKGLFTYEQAKNIAKAGTVESLTYDSVKGIQLGIQAFGLSAVLTFAACVWSGDDVETAFRTSLEAGIKVFGVAWGSTVISSQLARTGLEKAMRPMTDRIVNQLGSKAAAKIAAAVSGKKIFGAAAKKHVSKLMRGNMITTIATTAVLSSKDMIHATEGKISGGQLTKNLVTTGANVGVGTIGMTAGAAQGAAWGTAILPGVGTAVGGFLGGLFGAVAAGSAAGGATKFVMDQFIEDDRNIIIPIVEEQFGIVAENYLFGQAEADQLIGMLQEDGFENKLKDIFAADYRQGEAYDWIESNAMPIAQSRQKVMLLDGDALRKQMEELERSLRWESMLAAFLEAIEATDDQAGLEALTLWEEEWQSKDLVELMALAVEADLPKVFAWIQGQAVLSKREKLLAWQEAMDQERWHIIVEEVKTQKSVNEHLLKRYWLAAPVEIFTQDTAELMLNHDQVDPIEADLWVDRFDQAIEACQMERIRFAISKGGQFSDAGLELILSKDEADFKMLLGEYEINRPIHTYEGTELVGYMIEENEWDRIGWLYVQHDKYPAPQIINEYINACTEEGVYFDSKILHTLILSENEFEKKGLRKQTNYFKEIQKALINEKLIKQNPLFWLPGFRTLRPFKMIFAAFVYATFYSLVSFEEFVPMARVVLVYTFLMTLILITNPVDLRNKFPYFAKNKPFRGTLVFILFWFVSVCIMIAAIPQ